MILLAGGLLLRPTYVGDRHLDQYDAVRIFNLVVTEWKL